MKKIKRPFLLSTAIISFLLFTAFHAKKTEDDRPDFVAQALVIDHIVVGVSNLAAGMAEFEELSGVKPIYGGNHANGFSQNAIVNLGGGRYLEMLAPQDTPRGRRILSNFTEFKHITALNWSICTDDLEITANNLHNLGYQTSDISSGSRHKPNLEMLSWRTMSIKDDIHQKPFFVEWEDTSLHPSKDSPESCSLLSLELNNPEPEKLRKLTDALGVKITTGYAEKPTMLASLKCPKGIITFKN